MVDVGCITNKVESKSDKEGGQPMWLGNVIISVNKDDREGRSSGAIALEKWWARDPMPAEWILSPIGKGPSGCCGGRDTSL